LLYVIINKYHLSIR